MCVVCVHVDMCACPHVCVYAWACVCVCVCACACRHTCVNMHSDTHILKLLLLEVHYCSNFADLSSLMTLAFLCPLSDNVNFLTADGTKFTHPLHHLGKSVKDLPVLAIDSFRHMYIFPHDIKQDLG